MYEKNLYLKKILRNFGNFILFSPHLDDAVLSCGLLIDHLQKNKKNVSVITVFTNASQKPYSKEASIFVNKSGYEDAKKLFIDRKVEDKNALDFFRTSYKHLNFIDTAFRKNNYFQNKLLRTDILKSLNQIKVRPKTLLLAPLGIGKHPDHIILNKLAKKLKKPVLYWEDFPYNITANYTTEKFLRWNPKYKKAFILENKKNANKNKAIKMYKSQMKVLFKKGRIPNVAEIYFYSRDCKIFKNFFAELSDE